MCYVCLEISTVSSIYTVFVVCVIKYILKENCLQLSMDLIIFLLQILSLLKTEETIENKRYESIIKLGCVGFQQSTRNHCHNQSKPILQRIGIKRAYQYSLLNIISCRVLINFKIHKAKEKEMIYHEYKQIKILKIQRELK